MQVNAIIGLVFFKVTGSSVAVAGFLTCYAYDVAGGRDGVEVAHQLSHDRSSRRAVQQLAKLGLVGEVIFA